MFSIYGHASRISFPCPVKDRIKISTSVHSTMVCDIAIHFRIPLESDGRQIAMAHNDLAKVINAVIWSHD